MICDDLNAIFSLLESKSLSLAPIQCCRSSVVSFEYEGDNRDLADLVSKRVLNWKWPPFMEKM